MFFSDAKYSCLDVQEISVGIVDKVLGRVAPPLFFGGPCFVFWVAVYHFTHTTFWVGGGVCGYFRLSRLCTLFRSSSVFHLGDSTFFDFCAVCTSFCRHVMSECSKRTHLCPHSSKCTFYRHSTVFIACDWQRTVEWANKQTCTRNVKVYYFSVLVQLSLYKLWTLLFVSSVSFCSHFVYSVHLNYVQIPTVPTNAQLYYEGESNENLKNAIKIRNTARFSRKLTTVLLMGWRVADRWQYDARMQHDGPVVV